MAFNFNVILEVLMTRCPLLSEAQVDWAPVNSFADVAFLAEVRVTTTQCPWVQESSIRYSESIAVKGRRARLSPYLS